MDIAKVLKNGRSEVIRLSENRRLGSKEAYVKKSGDIVMIVPKKMTWKVFMQGLGGFSADFMNEHPAELPLNHRKFKCAIF